MERKHCWDIWFELLTRYLVVASILSYLWLYHMDLTMLSSLKAVFTYLSSNYGICAVPFSGIWMREHLILYRENKFYIYRERYVYVLVELCPEVFFLQIYAADNDESGH